MVAASLVAPHPPLGPVKFHWFYAVPLVCASPTVVVSDSGRLHGRLPSSIANGVERITMTSSAAAPPMARVEALRPFKDFSKKRRQVQLSPPNTVAPNQF